MNGLEGLAWVACYAMLLWAALGSLGAICALALPGERSERRNVPARIKLAGYLLELCLLLPYSFVVSAVASLPVLLASESRLAGAAMWGAQAANAFLFYMLVTSWGFFWATGHFLDRDGLAFSLKNFRMGLLQEAESAPLAILLLFFLLLVALIGPPIGFGALLEALRSSGTRHAENVAGAGLAAYALVALAAIALRRLALQRIEAVASSRFGSVIAGKKFVAAFLRNQSGPLSTMLLGGTARGDPAKTAMHVARPRGHAATRAAQANGRTARDEEPARRFIVVVIESFRADVLRDAARASKYIPTLHAISRESANFFAHYSNSSHSDYADVSIFNGRYPELKGRRGGRGRRDPKREPLVYEELARAGFRCAFFSSQDETWGGMYDRLCSPALAPYLHAGPGERDAYGAGASPALRERMAKRRHGGKFDDADTVAAAVDWLKRNEKQKTFLALNLQSTHVPFYVPEEFSRNFAGTVPAPKLRFARFSAQDSADVWTRYLCSLSYVDLQVRRLLDSLRSSGTYSDTAILITGDTGQAFYEHGFCCHGSSLFNEVIHVPMIVSGAKRRLPQTRIVTQHVDIAPTILDLAGLAIPLAYEGRSMFDACVEEKARVAYSVCETPLAHEVAAIAGGWKIIADRRLAEYFLYDLESDPGESSDCKRDYPGHLRDGVARIEDFLRRGDDTTRAFSAAPVLS